MSVYVIKSLDLRSLKFHDDKGVHDFTTTCVPDENDVAKKADKALVEKLNKELIERINALKEQIKYLSQNKIDKPTFDSLKAYVTSNDRLSAEKEALKALFEELLTDLALTIESSQTSNPEAFKNAREVAANYKTKVHQIENQIHDVRDEMERLQGMHTKSSKGNGTSHTFVWFVAILTFIGSVIFCASGLGEEIYSLGLEVIDRIF